MALLQEWHKIAYNEKAGQAEIQRFWQRYFLLEKGVYEQLLTNPDEVVEGTVKELAEKYNLTTLEMAGFLDGINDSLVTPNPIDEMEEDTKVSLAFDKEKLYKNMVDALDEMQICSIGKYVIDKISPDDQALLDKKGIK